MLGIYDEIWTLLYPLLQQKATLHKTHVKYQAFSCSLVLR